MRSLIYEDTDSIRLHSWKKTFGVFSSENPVVPSEMANDTLESGAIICFRLLFGLERTEFKNNVFIFPHISSNVLFCDISNKF